MQRAELKIRDAFFNLNHALLLTLRGWRRPRSINSFLSILALRWLRRALSEKLYAYLAANKSAGRPWGDPCGLTFTGCSLLFCHISLCFYSKSSSPGGERRRVFTDQKQDVGGRVGVGEFVKPLKWMQIRWSTCHRTGLAVFEVPNSWFLHAAVGLQSWKAVNCNSGRRVARGRAHLFVYCLLYILLYYTAVRRRFRCAGRSSEQLLVPFHPWVWRKGRFDQINLKQAQRLCCSCWPLDEF